MKLTKSALKKLIKEEVKSMLAAENAEAIKSAANIDNEVQTARELLKLGKTLTLKQPHNVVHRTSNLNLKARDLEPLAVRQTRQSKRGSSPKVGLYTYSEEDDVPRYGENKLLFTIPAGTKILDVSEMGRGTTSRIGLTTAKELLKNNITVVVGYDFIGPPEWILLKNYAV